MSLFNLTLSGFSGYTPSRSQRMCAGETRGSRQRLKTKTKTRPIHAKTLSGAKWLTSPASRRSGIPISTPRDPRSSSSAGVPGTFRAPPRPVLACRSQRLCYWHPPRLEFAGEHPHASQNQAGVGHPPAEAMALNIPATNAWTGVCCWQPEVAAICSTSMCAHPPGKRAADS